MYPERPKTVATLCLAPVRDRVRIGYDAPVQPDGRCAVRVWILAFVVLLGACGDGGGGGGEAVGDSAVDAGTDGFTADAPTTDVDVPPDAAEDVADSDDAWEAPDSGPCGPGQCVAPWNRKCEDDASFSICAPAGGSCLAWSASIACAGECVGGACEDGCVAPRALILVDRSSAMTGLLWDRTVAAINGLVADHPSGVELGVRVFPAPGTACDAGAPVAPAEGPTSIAAALVAPTASPSSPLATALTGLDGALGPPRSATLVLVLLAGTETCAAEGAVTQAVQGLRARGVAVHPIGVGDGADEHMLGVIAAASGEAIQNAVTAADIRGALLGPLVAAGACCVDADGDGRGSFCAGGPDCDDADGATFAPSCAGMECGGDGCGGSCGTCEPPPGGKVTCVEGACVTTCDPGTHPCGGACVSDDDPAHCGSSCEPCPSVAGGTATCDGTSCGFTCDGGSHACDGACVPDDSIAACGPDCVACPTDLHGSTACVDGACILTCAGGYLECEGTCAACPGGPGVAETGCAGPSCVVTACAPGFLPCAAGCCDRIVVDVAPASGDPNDGGSLSLAVDPFGVAHLAWADRKTLFSGEVRYASGTWQGFTTELVASGSHGVYGRPTRLVLDSQGRPVVAWRAGTTAASPVLMLARREAAGFDPPVQLADTFGAWPYGASDFALVAPKAGSLSAVYPSVTRLSIAWWTGLVVNQGTVADVAGATYTHAPAALGAPDGLLDVLHAEQVGSTWALVHAHGIDSGWTAGPVPLVLSPEGGSRMALARSPSGTLGLCAFTTGGLVLATQGEGWSAEIVDPEGRQACSLAYAPDGTPHVIYRTLYGAIRHAVGPEWNKQELGAPGGSPEEGLRWPSAGIDPKGGLHAAWWDQGAGVIRYFHMPVPAVAP